MMKYCSSFKGQSRCGEPCLPGGTPIPDCQESNHSCRPTKKISGLCLRCMQWHLAFKYVPANRPGPHEACDPGTPTGREDKASVRPGRKKHSSLGWTSSTIPAVLHTGCRSPTTPLSKDQGKLNLIPPQCQRGGVLFPTNMVSAEASETR